jgi:hypothetical protein
MILSDATVKWQRRAGYIEANTTRRSELDWHLSHSIAVDVRWEGRFRLRLDRLFANLNATRRGDRDMSRYASSRAQVNCCVRVETNAAAVSSTRHLRNVGLTNEVLTVL